jgi:hypothetical protein
MPSALHRFNWGAFLIPALWGFAYGAWPLVALWGIALVVPLALGVAAALVGGSGTAAQSVSAAVAVTVASDVVVAYIRLWSGANANRLFWEREAERLTSEKWAKPKMSTPVFLDRQRAWVMWGVLGTILGLALSIPIAMQGWKPYGLQWAAFVEPALFLVAQVALGAWLAHRMKLEFPEPVVPAQGVS